MSDRTRLVINYAECDREVFEAEFGVCEDEDTSDAGIVEATYDDVDGGGYDELTNIAALGIPFYGHHDDGCEYSGAYVAGNRNKYDEQVGGVADWTVCVDFDLDTGRVSGLAEARNFCRHWRGAIAAVVKRAQKR